MMDLSVIIVSYNTKDITKACLDKLNKSLQLSPRLKTEIIVVDNASSDGSAEMLHQVKSEKFKAKSNRLKFKIIENDANLGFARANNKAADKAAGKYVLFLNSDALCQNVNFEDLVYYMSKNPKVGAMTVRILLPNGSIDWASHRGFPTVWRSFTYFSKLEKLFSHVPKLSKKFGGYHLRHLDLNTIHEIDSPSGAFYFTRSSVLKKIGGFDTSFFIYGEDLDLSHRIISAGYKIVYYPLFTVTHLKYKSGIKKGLEKTEVRAKNHFYDAMRIFYDKHFAANNRKLINKLVYFFIDLKEKISLKR